MAGCSRHDGEHHRSARSVRAPGSDVPRLTAPQLARLARLGSERSVRAGDLIFDQGDRNVGFHVVLEGALAVVHPDAAGDQVIVVHGPGEFTGEIDQLSGRPALVRARMEADGRLLVLDRAHLRTVVQNDAELGELLMRAFILRRMGLIATSQGDVILIGSHYCASTLGLQEFLSRNGHPHTYVDVERDSSVQALLDSFHVSIEEIPVVICRGRAVMKRPTIEELATCLGLTPHLDPAVVHDVIVVGAGPSGLAAAVYAASEGLSVVVFEAAAPGGQAGSSSKIENYLGFPTGISGQALAGRAFTQAEKFGAEVSVASAKRLHCEQRPYELELSSGDRVKARIVVLATGAEYRKPSIVDRERFEGTGVYYGATNMEAQVCNGEEVVIVGGGNSAGQAAVYLSQSVARVRILVRGEGLKSSMSRYLIRRIEETPNIEVRPYTEIVEMSGERHLQGIVLRGVKDGAREELAVRHVFLMTGAVPRTAWLNGCLPLDAAGFVKAGADLTPEDLVTFSWPLARPPHMLETALPGVFAVGDVRSNSVKRVASAVGEGSISVQMIHRVLAE